MYFGIIGNWKTDAVFIANVFHIAPIEVMFSCLKGTSKCLKHLGIFCIYGPFRFGGEFTSPSNAEFDYSLKTNNPEWGTDFEQLCQVAEEEDLAFQHNYSMPANNQLLVFKKHSRTGNLSLDSTQDWFPSFKNGIVKGDHKPWSMTERVHRSSAAPTTFWEVLHDFPSWFQNGNHRLYKLPFSGFDFSDGNSRVHGDRKRFHVVYWRHDETDDPKRIPGFDHFRGSSHRHFLGRYLLGLKSLTDLTPCNVFPKYTLPVFETLIGRFIIVSLDDGFRNQVGFIFSDFISTFCMDNLIIWDFLVPDSDREQPVLKPFQIKSTTLLPS